MSLKGVKTPRKYSIFGLPKSVFAGEVQAMKHCLIPVSREMSPFERKYDVYLSRYVLCGGLILGYLQVHIHKNAKFVRKYPWRIMDVEAESRKERWKAGEGNLDYSKSKGQVKPAVIKMALDSDPW